MEHVRDIRFALTIRVYALTKLKNDTYKCIIEADESSAEGRCLKILDPNVARAWYTFGLSHMHSSLLHAFGKIGVPQLRNHFYMVTEPFESTLATYRGSLLANGLLDPEFATILTDILAAILFLFDHKASHGDICPNNVFIVRRVNGLRAKLGNIGKHRGENLSDDLCAFAQMIRVKFQSSKSEKMTNEVKIFLEMVRGVSTRRGITVAINHVVLARPEGRCAFRSMAWQKGSESKVHGGPHGVPAVAQLYLTNHGLHKQDWIAELPDKHAIFDLQAFKTPKNVGGHNFMYISRAFVEHANDLNVNKNIKEKGIWGPNTVDEMLNEAYDGFLAAWYQACAIDRKLNFASFREM